MFPFTLSVSPCVKRFSRFSVLMVVAGCAPTFQQKGWIEPNKAVWSQLTEGTASKETVQATLGTPTLVSTFDENVWYYVSRLTQSRATFSQPQLTRTSLWCLTFDPLGKLRHLDTLDPQGAVEVVVDRQETPTHGYTPSILSQMFRNLGRFNTGRVKGV
jgi:outer membrane protein assembly factor BamE (lipoprotein component of BamABCDE complex)